MFRRVLKGSDRGKVPTPSDRVILEKLIVTQLFKKFPLFYGTRTVFLRSRYWPLLQPD